MANEWPKVSLREANVTLIDCDHRTPPASESGYPYVAIPQLRNGRIDFSDARRITPEHFIAWTRKALPKENDVVLSRRCNPGETAFVASGMQFALGQNLVLLRSDGTKIYPPYLRWLVRGPEWWEQIGKYLNVGAVFDSLKCADVPNFKLSIPPIREQRAIAHVLGALDDKIELNRRMNETLEGMARALFKSWFVDFDPVRAKAEGRDTGLPKELADLFPNAMAQSPLGNTPTGWEVETLGGVLELAYGKALKENDRQVGTTPVYGSNGQVGWHNEKLVSGPGIIIGRKGNPGLVTWASTDFYPIDTTFYIVTKPKCKSLYFLFYALKGQNLGSLGADSAVPGLNRNIAYMSSQLLPSPSVLDAFDSYTATIFERVQKSSEQSITLAALRDTLLPKLTSGELHIAEPGAFLGDIDR